MIPQTLKVWKDANRKGSNYEFKNGKQLCDNNWIDETWRENGFWRTINDKVSSIDQFYRVINLY